MYLDVYIVHCTTVYFVKTLSKIINYLTALSHFYL